MQEPIDPRQLPPTDSPPQRLIRVSMLALTVVLHGAVIVTLPESLAGPAGAWRLDVQIYTALSLAMSATIYLARVPALNRVLLGVRLVLYLIVGGSIAIRPLTATLLITALGADAAGAFSMPWNVIAVFSVLIVALAGELMPTSLNPEVIGRSQMLPLLPIPVAIAGLGLVARMLADRLRQEQEHVQTLNDAVIQLTSANSGFLRYASNAERESALEERRHITRELHDIVGQTLTDIISMMDAAVRNPMDTVDEQRRLHQWVRDQSQRCLGETREVLYRLRAMPDAPLSGTSAIQSLVETFSASTGVRVRLEWSNSPADFGPRLNSVFYRVVQEALVNAFRHGRASEVLVEFRLEGDRLNVLIEDDGRGSAESKKGIGQAGMEERVGEIGGEIRFGSTANGYQVHARCPYDAVRDREATADTSR